MSRIVEISPTTRHEGHSKLVLQIDNDGIVERGDWVSINPVRGIEKLAIGKSMEYVPKIASRVCGICPVAHVLSGIGAMEASIGCEIPKDAHTLRVIMQCANRLNSHAFHNILILPDLYLPGTDTKINPWAPEEPVRSAMKRILRLRQIGQAITQIVGGEAIHPSNPRVGGMYRNISPQAKTKAYDLAKEGIPLAHEQMDFMIALLRNFQDRDWSGFGETQVPIPKKLGYHNQGYMATDPIYGTTSLADHPSWDPDRHREVRPPGYYMGECKVTFEDPTYPIGGTSSMGTEANPQRETCTGIPLYDGQPVEVGPLARMKVFHHFDERGTIGQAVARQLEYTNDLDLIITGLDELDTGGKVMADMVPGGDGSPGWAVNEAPRGSNVHFVRVKNKKVQWFSMLVPTTWNFPVAGMALAGSPWQLAEFIIRGFDPCVSCASHMIVIDEKQRIVAQKLIA